MDDFINIIKKDPQVQIKMKDMLDKFKRLPLKYQSKLGYDTLIQNVILEELMNLLGTFIVDIDIELKRKISGIEFLESKLWWLCNFISI